MATSAERTRPPSEGEPAPEEDAPRRLRIAYTIQNVGIDLAREIGDAVPVLYTLRTLSEAGPEVDVVQLDGGAVHRVGDVRRLDRRETLPLGLSGRRAWRLAEGGVRRAQRALGLPYFALFDSWRFYQACRRIVSDYDLCHEHNGLFSVGTALACARRQVPYVLTFSADPLLELDLLGRPLTGLHARVARRAARFTHATAHRILCVSEPAKQHLVSEWSVPPEKIEVLPNGVDLELFGEDVDPARARARLGLADAPVVLFVGAFQQWHGVEILVESFARVLERVPSARLVLVGDGPARAAIERRIAALEIGGAVTLTGIVPHSSVPEYLAIANVSTLPYPELPQELWFSPLKLYESMASGRAIVASRAGQIADVLEDGDTGVLVAPGDRDALAEALVRLLQSPEEQVRLGHNARRRAVERYSWRSYAARLESIYRGVLSRHRAAPESGTEPSSR